MREGSGVMTSIEQYRANAENCLRQASTDRNEHDKPLWITLAQSWLRLAEHADRVNSEIKDGKHEDELEVTN
jgi:putative IMPACT (imprinted ancient) family translation regulator